MLSKMLRFGMLVIGLGIIIGCSFNDPQAGVINTGNTTKIYGYVTQESLNVIKRMAKSNVAVAVPVESMKVYLSQDSSAPVDSMQTDASGLYAFSGMAPGVWIVQVWYDSTWIRDTVQLQMGDTLQANLNIGNGGTIGASSSAEFQGSSSSTTIVAYSYTAPVDTCQTIYGENTITDCRDGKVYKTVQIGTQVWMAQNLNYGEQVDTGSGQTNENVPEKYCYGNQKTYCDIYGGVYTWTEAMGFPIACGSQDCSFAIDHPQGLCPEGWSIGDADDWSALMTALGGIDSAGKALLDTNSGFANWGIGATNSTGFSALPSILFDESAGLMAGSAAFWSSYPMVTTAKYYWGIESDTVSNRVTYGLAGFAGDTRLTASIRCMKNP